MATAEPDWQKVSREARSWLLRVCPDAWTRNHRDDVAQDAVFAVWRWSSRMIHRERFWAALRTILRRHRHRGRRNAASSCVEAQQECVEAAAEVVREQPDTYYTVAGRRCPADALRPLVASALKQLPEFDRRLLWDYYAGSSCAELAQRHRCSAPGVKARLFRARRRVQKYVEAFARVAGGLGDGS
ncbi:MAG: RNA polymerase sigma factor [Planctomycetota bacterium]|jgi:RNA polymerase sigma factor (sigma-70 family)